MHDWEYCPECNRNYAGAVYPETETEKERLEISRLIQQIHNAFANVVLGEGDTIHQAHLEGIYGRGQEWVEAGMKDPESEWSEVPAWKIEGAARILSFLDTEGWRFYLPAFMCWSLANWRTTSSPMVDSLIDYLVLDEANKHKFNALDRPQSKAVYRFLDFFVKYSGDKHNDARMAIQSYWHIFEHD